MMFLRRCGWVVGVVTFGLCSTVACREDEPRFEGGLPVINGQGGSGGSGGAPDPVVICEPQSVLDHRSPPGIGQIPPPVPSAPVGDGAPMQFAVTRMFLGDTDREGSPSPNAWRDLGRDIDGLSSDPAFDCHCKSPSKQAKSDIRRDGTNGIDNAFGNIVIAQGTLPIESASQAATHGIETGRSSLVLSFADLGEAPDYGSIRATVSPVQMPVGQEPRFDATDHWLPFADAPLAGVTLDGGWVNEHTWISPPTEQTLTVTVFVGSLPMRLPLQQPRITAKLSSDRREIERGTISGVMVTEAYVEGVRALVGALGLCGAAFDSVGEQLRQVSDTPLNGIHEPTIVCDGISIGIGFRARRTGTLGEPIPVPVEPDPCLRP